jgi:hypothetical protein
MNGKEVKLILNDKEGNVKVISFKYYKTRYLRLF